MTPCDANSVSLACPGRPLSAGPLTYSCVTDGTGAPFFSMSELVSLVRGLGVRGRGREGKTQTPARRSLSRRRCEARAAPEHSADEECFFLSGIPVVNLRPEVLDFSEPAARSLLVTPRTSRGVASSSPEAACRRDLFPSSSSVADKDVLALHTPSYRGPGTAAEPFSPRGGGSAATDPSSTSQTRSCPLEPSNSPRSGR